MSLNIFLFILYFITISKASYLEIYNTSDTLINSFKFQAPPFSFGNLDFPISGKVVFGSGCDGIREIENNPEYIEILKEASNSSNSKLIALIQYKSDDDSCLSLEHVFACQQSSWCIGVLVEQHFFSPGGFPMWGQFDKYRPRTDYKVPLVESSLEEFDELKKHLENSLKQNFSYQLTLTEDKNLWGEMFLSVGFFIYFRILCTIWSVGCLILATAAFFKKSVSQSTFPEEKSLKQYCRLKFNLKRLCLFLHCLTQLARIPFFAVDPFWSQRVIPFLPSYLIVTCITAFEIATNILLSFVIRELTQAVKVINVLEKAKYSFILIMVFLLIDFAIGTTNGLQLTFTNNPNYILKGLFYVVMNILLGFWYFWQGYSFLKKTTHFEKKLQRKNKTRIMFTRISMINSIGLIAFGCVMVFTTSRDFVGRIEGYPIVFGVVSFIIQITSFLEILLFGNVAISFKSIRVLYHKWTGTLEDSSTNDFEI